MNRTAGGKWFGSVPATTNADATNSLTIDRIGYDYVTIAVSVGTNALTTKPTTLKLTHSDTTDATAFGAISATFTGGSATSSTVGFVIADGPGAVTTIQPHTVFNVDARALKRYIKAAVTPGATSICGITAIATRGCTAPAPTVATGPVTIVNG